MLSGSITKNCRKHLNPVNREIEAAASTLLTIAPTLITLMSLEDIDIISTRALERGYLTPDEDDIARTLFAKFLSSRAALIQTMEDLRPLASEQMRQKTPDHPEVFIVCYAAACLLMRTGYLLIDAFRKDSLLVKKLNEAEPRFGIPRKQFTKIYRSSTSPLNVWSFLEANRYWEENRHLFQQRYADNPAVKSILDLLESEDSQVEISKRFYATNRLKYRLHSFLRRHHSGFKNVTFALFKTSGRLVSEIRFPKFWKRKRVTARVRKRLADMLVPGDVIVTRHDDAASNLFLPGFWPHAALYIGTEAQRAELGLVLSDDHQTPLDKSISVLEAQKDGVRFRKLSYTLGVDACTILRPKLSREEIRQGLERAISHEGKEYDFEFDFRRSDKLVCTEVIYRGFHNCGSIRFELSERAGRLCLAAEDLVARAIDGSIFDVVALFGAKGNRLFIGDRAKKLLMKTS